MLLAADGVAARALACAAVDYNEPAMQLAVLRNDVGAVAASGRSTVDDSSRHSGAVELHTPLHVDSSGLGSDQQLVQAEGPWHKQGPGDP